MKMFNDEKHQIFINIRQHRYACCLMCCDYVDVRLLASRHHLTSIIQDISHYLLYGVLAQNYCYRNRHR